MSLVWQTRRGGTAAHGKAPHKHLAPRRLRHLAATPNQRSLRSVLCRHPPVQSSVSMSGQSHVATANIILFCFAPVLFGLVMRQLKHHEQKLLKKHDFLNWKSDEGQRAYQVMRRYHVQDRGDYLAYNKICGEIRKMSHLLAKLPAEDPFRITYEGNILSKLYDMGILNRGAKMSDLEGSDAPVIKGYNGEIKEPDTDKYAKLTVAAFCRRRLPIVLVRLRYAETVKAAVQFVEQGHIRIGPDTITDPAFLVTRQMEDFITWTDGSKLKRRVMEYNDEVDDFDLL